MNTLIKRLPLFAFILTAFAAVAFTSPQSEEWGQVDEDTFINVTNLTPGPLTYQCNGSSGACTRSSDDPTAPVIKPGVFQNNMD